jgi:hypothetical protein
MVQWTQDDEALDMHDAAVTRQEVSIPLHPGFSRAELRAVPHRSAPLVRQPRRRDGALQFALVLYLLFVVLAGAIAFTRGAPIKHGAPTVAKTPAAQSAPADAH